MPNVEYVLGMKDSGLSSGIQKATGHAKQLDSTLDSVKGKLGGLGAAVTAAFSVATVVMFTKKVIEAGTTVEDATTGLTTLLGSASEAAQVVKNTMEDATKTPFAFEGLLAGNKALISAGASAQQARTDVLNLANAIAATGGGNDELQRMVINMQQIKNIGVATSQDIKQFGFAGINIYKVLAEATGKSIAQVKEMPVTYETLTEALKKAHEKGGIYFNGLENMAKNTSVKISNIGDSLFQMFNNIFVKLKPEIDEVLGNVLSGMGSINMDPFLDKFKEGLVVTIKLIKGIVDFFKPLFKALFEGYNKSYEALKKVFAAFGQFSSEGKGLMEILKTGLTKVIEVTGTFISYLIKGIAVIIDIAHTIYVLLQKLGIIWVFQKLFDGFLFVMKEIGNAMLWVYNNVILPVVKAIEWAYNKVKGLLGIKEVTVKSVVDTGTKTNESLLPDKPMLPGGALAPPEAAAPKTKAEGSKNINIHVAYNAPLIKDFTISTTNIKEGLGALKEKVTEILTAATHDSVMIADI